MAIHRPLVPAQPAAACVAHQWRYADVRPYLHRSALMVVPLNIARGTQNKVLEAMASGLPVVASRSAAGGVDAKDKEHFLVASTPEEYAAAILRLIEDPAERQRLARAGRERMLSNHAWEQSMRRLDGIIERCLLTAARARMPRGAAAQQEKVTG